MKRRNLILSGLAVIPSLISIIPMRTKNGFKVISQRDFASLEILYSKIDNSHLIDIAKKDHYEIEWYKEYFKK